MTEKLEPCPFCGGEMLVESGILSHADMTEASRRDCPLKGNVWAAACHLPAWNSRATPSPSGETIQAQARELLADSFSDEGLTDQADWVRSGGHGYTSALRAIEQALTHTPQSRDDVIEECARVADKHSFTGMEGMSMANAMYVKNRIGQVAKAIRALASPIADRG